MYSFDTELKVSIIVAVYNVEKYIQRCLDSLLAQTYHNIEIILVDDGSTDRSGIICDEYVHNDSRCKVIHKPNGGVSTARQAGLDVATGDYVIHADPDDYADANMIEELLAKAIETDADIVTCDFYMNEKRQTLRYTNSDDLLKKLIDVDIICVCWNTLVKRDFIVRHHVTFSPDWLCLSEDFLFICRLLVNGANSVHLNNAFYHYWITNFTSLSNRRSEKKLNSLIVTITEISHIVDIANYDNLYSRKKMSIRYVYQAKMFDKVKNMYPEIHERLINEGKGTKIFSPPWQLSHAIKGNPCIIYYICRIYYYLSTIIAMICKNKR